MDRAEIFTYMYSLTFCEQLLFGNQLLGEN